MTPQGIHVNHGRHRGDGYSVATVQDSPNNLAVYFNEVNHSFIIHVAWNINKPFAEVSEIGE